MSKFGLLIQAIVAGNREEAAEEAEKLLQEGHPLQAIIRDGLTAALALLGPRCTAEDFNLLELMLAGRAMLYVMDRVIEPRLQHEEVFGEQARKIIIGTIQGDIHDLGRHILSNMLTAAGYHVVDLGKDVSPENFVERCKEEGAAAIGISSLITTTSPAIRQVKTLCREQALEHVRVLAGGAGAAQASAEYLNVDYVANDVFAGLNYLLQEVPPHGTD